MEHNFILVMLADKIGLGEWAHHYTQVLYSWLVILILIILGRLAAAKPTFVPGKLQNVAEAIIETLENFQFSMMGEAGRAFFPLIATLAIYIFTCNIQGLIPGSYAPTSNINTTLALALIVFTVTHYVGVRQHGFRYVKHFMGPLLPMAPIMFPIEVISHLSRVLSLTMRLFGNVMGEDLVLAILFFLAGKFLLPLPMMALAVFTGGMQAFIFMILTMVYISGSLEEAH